MKKQFFEIESGEDFAEKLREFLSNEKLSFQNIFVYYNSGKNLHTAIILYIDFEAAILEIPNVPIEE